MSIQDDHQEQELNMRAELRHPWAATIGVITGIVMVLAGGRPVSASSVIWRAVPSPNPSTTPVSNNVLSGVSALADGDVWAVGSYSSSGGNNVNHTLIEHWNGSVWSVVPSPDAGTHGSQLLGVAAVSDSDVWAVGNVSMSTTVNGNRTLIEHWNGAAWSVVASPNPSMQGDNLTAIAAISATNVWAVGSFETNNQGANLPLIEHWNGAAWSVVTAGIPTGGSTFLQGLTAISATDIWAVGYAGFGSNVEMHWNGTRWSTTNASFPTGGQETLRGVAAVSSTDIWAVGSYAPTTTAELQTLALHWDGSAWSKVTTANLDQYFNLFYSVAAVASNDVWAVGYAYPTNGLGFSTLIEHWDGSQWTIVPSPTLNGSEFRGLVVSSPADLWTVGSYDSLMAGNPGLRTLTAHTAQG